MSTGNELVTLKQVDNYYKDLRKRSAPVIFNTAIGNPAVFSDGADGLPIQSLKVHLLPRQEGTGDPSPENIRNFIPWNGIDIFGGGKNLLDEETIPAANRYIKYTSPTNAQWNASQDSRSYKMEVEPNTTYTIRALNPAITTFRVCALENGDLQEYSTNAFQWNGTGERVCTITTSATEHYLIIQANRSVLIDRKGYIFVGKGTPSDNPINEVDVTFPSPIYGGIPDVVRGKMIVNYVRYDLVGDNVLAYGTASTGVPYVRAAISSIMKTNGVLLAEKYPTVTSAPSQGSTGVRINNGDNLYVYDEAFTSQDVAKEILNTNPVVIVYELSTPYEVDIDSSVLMSLYGINTIRSDANGDIDVEYRADTELFLKQNVVQDVQINGSSVLTDGVANVPMAASGRPGVIKPDNFCGTEMNGETLRIFRALESDIKTGTQGYRPITPSFQHVSAFYALAKAAGADMAQSSNPVGQFTDEAKIAIQKMLGIYEAPWELIREDTVTNETAGDITIDVDGNGESFELTDLILQIKVPANSNTVIGSYGLVNLFYYTNSDTYVPAMLNAFSGPKQHDWFASIYVKNEKNALSANYAPYSESGNNRTVNVRNQFDFNYGITKIIKILFKNVQGTITYKLYGKRKWN